MAQKSTVYDVAQLAGVSIATVSFAFTKPDKVKPDTIAAVMAAADELGYVPSASARGLAKGRTGAIGLYAFDYLLDEPEDPSRSTVAPLPSARVFPLYSDEVQRGVQLGCRDAGFALMIGGNRTPEHLPHVIEVAGRVDGLIAFAGALSLTHLKQAAARVPIVELGGEVRAKGAHTVLVDNGGGMAELTTHLLDVHGFTRFAYIGEQGTPEFRARWNAFEAALRGAGVPVPEVLRGHPGDDASTIESVRALLTTGALPDVIVCDTDQSALVAIDELRRAGLDVPRDVAVAGFDGILAGRLITPTLTTVRQPMEEVGRMAVRILTAAIAGDPLPEQSRPLPSTLVVGGSCGCG
ncbi:MULTISPECIES: LacI family DNA-binding transcriptional regulator [unclassified Microbacterium]|uniref:LacI family DNA-binding transcriptional regulator n=1 Tax=unclassified Microbacterium TaxID=2609290 RepID=UPI000EAA7633|nr:MULTISPECIES: LacI family DNA-binding transcriptional regulator [unclassified Microbacterium]MBT2486181.1 LacI family DNA-binding transcriptional regulator [Microbacterium sp. ISL-108]RKN68906.1 LacI family transcriptional regulator [Microbacterium sp. CGR2]